ncbi:MAG: type II secretion system protein [Phycisphaerae bacterium]
MKRHGFTLIELLVTVHGQKWRN